MILGETLVEERLIRFDGRPVTIGQSLRCTLSIPADGVPAEHVLFAEDPTRSGPDRWLLHLTDGITGRLAHGAAVELIEPPRARTVPVERGMRGKLQLGAATVLFQELAAPPVQPRPQLPASVRGTFGDRIDRRLAAIVGASLLAHLGIALWAWQTDRITTDLPEEDPLAEYTPPTVTELPAELIEPVAPPPADASGEPGPGVARPANPRVQTPKGNPPPPRLADPDPVDAARWAQVLTGNTPGRDGQQEIKSRTPGAALDQQIDDIRSNDREVRIGNDPRLREGDPVRRGTTRGPDIEDPQFAHNQPKVEQLPPVRIVPVPRPHPPDAPTLTAEEVVRRIQSQYMLGLQRCYQKGLAGDAALSARVAVSFTVTEKGGVDDAVASGAGGDVDPCIRGQMSLWRFPIPRDGQTREPTDASFSVTLVLRPS